MNELFPSNFAESLINLIKTLIRLTASHRNEEKITLPPTNSGTMENLSYIYIILYPKVARKFIYVSAAAAMLMEYFAFQGIYFKLYQARSAY